MAFDVLDQLSIGIVLVDRFAKVLFANVAAHSLSAGESPLRLNSRLTSATSATRLEAFIRSALDSASSRAISVPSPRSGRSLMVVVSPLRSANRERSEACDAHNAAALIMLCDPDRPAQVPVAWMMDAFGLSMAEVRVASTAYLGSSITDTAHRLKLSPNTVKTHLRHIYEKTGTKRQAELSRLLTVIGMSRPFLDHPGG